MKKVSKRKRLQAYREAVNIFKFILYDSRNCKNIPIIGICGVFKHLISESYDIYATTNNRHNFPELFKRSPIPIEYTGYWFELTNEGILKRIVLLQRCIADIEEKKLINRIKKLFKKN